MRIKYIYRFIIDSFTNFLFEKDPLVKELENMDTTTFRSRVEGALRRAPSMYALFSYKDPLVKALIWNIKFRMNKKCIKLAGKLLHEEIIKIISTHSQDSPFDAPLLIPVPLSPQRKRQRTYNQTECLVEEIIKNTITTMGTIVVETGASLVIKKNVSTQTSLSRKERQENLRNSFVVTHPEKIAGRNIIIIDDVITTGATVTELSKVLREAGAKKIIALALAH